MQKEKIIPKEEKDKSPIINIVEENRLFKLSGGGGPKNDLEFSALEFCIAAKKLWELEMLQDNELEICSKEERPERFAIKLDAKEKKIAIEIHLSDNDVLIFYCKEDIVKYSIETQRSKNVLRYYQNALLSNVIFPSEKIPEEILQELVKVREKMTPFKKWRLRRLNKRRAKKDEPILLWFEEN